jgi:hypothetical protein
VSLVALSAASALVAVAVRIVIPPFDIVAGERTLEDSGCLVSDRSERQSIAQSPVSIGLTVEQLLGEQACGEGLAVAGRE